MANQLLFGPGIKKLYPTNKAVARGFRVLIVALLILLAVEYFYGSIHISSPLPLFITRLSLKSVKTADRQNNVVISSTQRMFLNNSTQNSTKRFTSEGLLNISKAVTEFMNKIIDKTPTTTKKPEALPVCKLPADLGPIKINTTPVDLASVEMKYPHMKRGGWYIPLNCTARHNVAILVPYRSRSEQMPILMDHLHPMLMKQQIEYRIFVINQLGSRPFNRAKLFNVGFVESNKMRSGRWDCYIFHDVDLVPMDERNLYGCSDQPKHLSPARDTTKFKLSYEGYFGGVSALTYKQFTAVNGFSNNFWGWGAEDDNMYTRLTKKLHFKIKRDNITIGRYTMLKHKKSAPNPVRYQVSVKASKDYKIDGLSSLKYELADYEFHPLYTFINVNID